MDQPSSPYDYEENQTQTVVNMTGTERNVAMIGGAALLIIALVRRGWLGLGLGALGTALLYQGSTGVSVIYQLLRQNRAVHDETAAISVPHEQGKHVSASITINRPVEEIYAFWRDFSNLPRFMSYLKSVEVQSDTLSHWSINGPVGTTIEWDAEIINDEANRVIGWRTLENAYLNHAGSVRFKPAPYDQGTEVQVQLEYLPIGGLAGVTIANVLGHAPEQQVPESLRQLKQILETGTIPTANGQNSSHARTGI